MPDYLYWVMEPWQRQGTRVVVDVHDIMSHLALHRFKGLKRRFASWALMLAERAVWLRVDHVITVHEAYREAIIESGVAPGRVSVVLNSPDPSLVRPALRKTPAANEFKIVFHGSVTERSGIVEAVLAMRLLVREVPRARLLVIGSGDHSGAVRRAIEESRLEEYVTHIDRYVPIHEVVELIADAHAAVVPNQRSRYTELMLPVKLLEYATLGIPVVATKLPLVQQYFNGGMVHLVERSQAELIAGGLAMLAQDPAYAQRLAATAQERVAEYRWSRYSRALAHALGLPEEVACAQSPQEAQP
jgi:glycosyltransferase involved in cell wall biosynthesis